VTSENSPFESRASETPLVEFLNMIAVALAAKEASARLRGEGAALVASACRLRHPGATFVLDAPSRGLAPEPLAADFPASRRGSVLDRVAADSRMT
jgi:hypothetical protein